MSTLHRELSGIISALQFYEHFIIGSLHQIKIFCDQKQLLRLWARIGRLFHRFFRYQVIITQLTNLKIIWTPGNDLAFPDLLSRNVSLKDLTGHQLVHKEIPKGIRFFNQSGYEVQYLLGHKSSADDGTDDIYPFVCTHRGARKTFNPKNDGTEMICTIYGSNSPKVLFNISDSFGEGKNINNRRKWQAPPMVVEAEVHENYYSEIESDSEIRDNEAYNEDLVLNQAIEDCQKANFDSTSSIFFVHEPNKTLKFTTDTLDCDNSLVNQETDSVLKTVRSWISKGKLHTKDVESQQCKGLLGYANQFEKMFVDKETQLVCRKREISPKQICLPQKLFIEAFNAAHDHRLSGHPGSEKTPFISETTFHLAWNV